MAYRWQLLALLWLTFFLNQADRQAFNVVLPLIRAELRLTDLQLGMVASLFSLAFALSLPFAGYAGDVLSRKRLIVWSLALWSLATMLTGLTGGVATLVLCRSLATGSGEAMYFPAANSLIGQHHIRTRSIAMAIHQTAVYTGLIASGFLAGWIGDHYGWRATFVIFGAAGVALAPVFALRVADSPQPVSGARSLAAELPALRREVIAKPTFLLMSLAFCCMVFVNVGYLAWMPTHLHETFGFTLARAGFEAMVYHHVGTFIGVLIGGWCSDTLARRRFEARAELAGVGLLAGAPFLLLLGNETSAPVVFAGLLGFGLLRGLYEANMWVALFDVIPSRFRGQATALVICFAYIVGAIAPTLLGWMKSRHGLAGAFPWLAPVYLAGGIAIFIARAATLQRDRLMPEAKTA
jgi:MFS family permease